MTDGRDNELARNLRDAMTLLTRALSVISDDMEDMSARGEVRDKITELTRIVGHIEARYGL